MADTPNQDPQTDRDGPGDSGAPKRRKLADLFDRFLTKKWLAIVLGVSLLGHVVGLSVSKLEVGGPQKPLEAEVALGDYEFVASRPEHGEVAGASFSVHLALLEEVEGAARERLDARTFRVRQQIEQLLRRAHGHDFDDPLLAELKRQLQEEVNRALELRAIAEVIITDLEMDRVTDQPQPIAETAESLPWVEPSAG